MLEKGKCKISIQCIQFKASNIFNFPSRASFYANDYYFDCASVATHNSNLRRLIRNDEFISRITERFAPICECMIDISQISFLRKNSNKPVNRKTFQIYIRHRAEVHIVTMRAMLISTHDEICYCSLHFRFLRTLIPQ